MCIQHLWPFKKSINQVKADENSINSEDDSSQKQHSLNTYGSDSKNRSGEIKTTPYYSLGQSLIRGRWVQDTFKNDLAYYNAVAATNADLHAAKAYHEDPLFASFLPIDGEGLWVMEFESLQRGKIKNVLKMGEECDELTPHRQWVKSFFKMTSDNVMEGLRKYKNGTQVKVLIEVQSSNPDVLIVKTIVDDIVSVFIHKRIKD